MECVRSVKGAPSPVGAYSSAVRSGGFIFCAGQIALDPATGEFVPGDVQAQTKRVLLNLEAVLKECGVDFKSVVLTTIFLADMSHFKEVNQVYQEFVNLEAPPARQTVAVKQLPLGAFIEISVIAEAVK